QGQNYDRAAAAYDRAAKLSTRDGKLYLKLSSTLRSLGQQKDAFEAAKHAAALLPNDADAQGRYGLLLKAEKQRPAALQALRRANQLRRDDRLYFMALVDMELDTLQMDQAERDLRDFMTRHPDDPEANFRMAVVYNQKPRTPENMKTAIRYAEKALPGLSTDARPYTVLGQLYLDSNRPKDALQLYLIGHQVAPNAESILRGLGDCYSRLGRTKEMALVSEEYRRVLTRHDRIDHLTHVMSFNHNDIASGLELARLSEEEGLLGKAQQYYEQLVRQAPKDARTRKALSGFYTRQGRPDLGKRALDPAFLP
ncbi:MAG TPA: tetratricopeptide repeat protein, partial [Armatimonadota bacterium]|nr:tetratricopeptide repeat protein [Armatimonadota bacterium]